MKDKLIYFLSKYGNDFFHKLPMYKTANITSKGQNISVGLKQFYFDSLTFRVNFPGDVEPYSTEKEIDLFELDDFCL